MEPIRNRLVSLATALFILCIFIFGSYLMSGCQASNTTKGGAVGAATGGAIGAAIGSGSDNTAVGAIIGAAVGGTAGALIGRRMDKQAEELRRDLEGVEVERVGEGIKLTFDSGLLFDLDSYELRSETKQNLSELSATLQKYEDTNILIEGHTDNSGSDAYNQSLSVDRAEAVSDYISSQGVAKKRIDAVGYGESQPVADNTTVVGRQDNRRVEVAIYANEKMKKMAKKGEL